MNMVYKDIILNFKNAERCYLLGWDIQKTAFFIATTVRTSNMVWGSALWPWKVRK